MNITKKQIKDEQIKIENKILFIGDKTYRNSDIIIGFIGDKYFEGRLKLYDSNNVITVFQNQVNGGYNSGNTDMYGFNFGYSLTKHYDLNTFSSSTMLYNYKADKDFDIEELNKKYPLPNLYIDTYGALFNRKHNLRLFKLKDIEKCCGAILLYDFPRNSYQVKHKYDQFTEEDIKELKDYISKYLPTNKICYLLKLTESDSTEFITEKLDFKIVNEFNNKNSRNDLILLSKNN